MVDQREAARYLLALKKASLSFPGFMDFYYPEFEYASFQREMQEVLDLLEKDALLSKGGNPVRNVLVTMPPRHAKSFHTTINLPAYELLRKPYREVMVSAYNGDLATTFGRATRDIAADAKVMRAFKGFQLSRETRAVDFWKTTDGGAYYAVGLNGTTTGRGVNCLHVDDPIKSREEADSTLMRRRVWDFYTSGLLSRLQPDRDGQPPYQVVTMTRWHPDDMAGRIMESKEFKSGEWLHLNFMALRVSERSFYIKRSELPIDDPGYIPAVRVNDVEPGVENRAQMVFPKTHRGKQKGVRSHVIKHKDETEQALWPERFPVEWLRKQKTLLGDRDFEALYQQNPYVLGGNLIKEGWFRRYKPEQLPADMHAVAISVDTAFKIKQANDYSVFTIGGITEMGDIYILGVAREKLEFPDLKRKASALNAAWRGRGLRGLWVEDAASGQSLAQELRANTSIPVLMWKPGSQDKFARANAITPLIEAGRVFIPEEADWLDDWLSELVSFPSSKHDDQVDSLVILLDVLSRMVVTGMSEINAPLGYIVERLATKGDLLFANQPLVANPKGWAGDAELAGAMRSKPWNGWGQ